MNEIAVTLLWALARATFWLSVAAVSLKLILVLLRCRSPSVHRTAWFAALVCGWLLVPAKLTIPWYVAPPKAGPVRRLPTTEVLEVAAVGESSRPTDARMPGYPPMANDAEPGGADRAAKNWPLALASCWVLGMVVIFGRWLRAYTRFVRHLPPSLPPAEEWRAEWNDALAELAVRQPVLLVLTEGIGPLVCRTWDGYQVLAPLSLWQELSPRERRAILRHELAHVSRGDLLKSLIARCLALPHWFNPIAWWLVRNYDECGEWACDDAVRSGEANEAITYARVLLRLGQTSERPLFGAAIGGLRLSTRVKRLLDAIPPEDSIMKKSLLAALVMLLVLAGAVELRLGAAEQEGDGARGDMNVDPAMLQDMAEAAAKTYEGTEACYEMGTDTLANVYVWSRRWLDAERGLAKTDADDLAALRRHRERMKLLMRKVRALNITGSKGGESQKFHAARYYLAEASAWLAAAKHRKATHPTLKNVNVSFRGPKGMIIRCAEGDTREYGSQSLASPASHEFLEGRLYFLQFSGVGTAKLEALLDLTSASDKAVPVELTIADVKKIATGISMRRVFFRTDRGDIDVVTVWDTSTPPPPPDMLVTPRADGSRGAIDVWNTIVSETERHHEVIAVLDVR